MFKTDYTNGTPPSPTLSVRDIQCFKNTMTYHFVFITHENYAELQLIITVKDKNVSNNINIPLHISTLLSFFVLVLMQKKTTLMYIRFATKVQGN